MEKRKGALTAPVIARLIGQVRAGRAKERELPVGSVPGLYIDLGRPAWTFRARRPDGRPGRMKIGSVDLSGKENGKPVKGGHLSLAGANVVAAEQQHLVALGRDPFAEHVTEKERRRVVAIEKAASTFSAAAAQFVKEHKVPRKNRKPRNWGEVARILGLDYVDGSEPTLRKGGLAERWKDKPLGEIDGHDIYSLIDEARRRGIPGMGRSNAGISDARGRHLANALGGLFGWLHEHRKIVVNPTLGVWKPPAPAARDRVLNTKLDVRRADELRWFWSSCEKLAEPWGALLKLLLTTGLRRDEGAQLQWKELSDDFSTLRLDGSRTKNGRPHELALPAMVQQILRGVKRIERSPFVFTGLTGKTPVSGWSKIKTRVDELMLAEARKERDDDIEPWVVHDLRRTAASTMQHLGVRVEVIERALNHISGSFSGVSGTYQRDPLSDEVRAALARLAEHIERAVSGKSGSKVVPIHKTRA